MSRMGTVEMSLKSESSKDQPVQAPVEPPKPKINLKKLHWKKMPATENTIWGQFENEIEIDVTDVPNLFAQKPAAAAATKEVAKDHHLSDLGKALV